MNNRIRDMMSEIGIDVNYLTNTKQIVLLDTFAEKLIKECGYAVDSLYEAYDAPKTASKFLSSYFGLDDDENTGTNI